MRRRDCLASAGVMSVVSLSGCSQIPVGTSGPSTYDLLLISDTDQLSEDGITLEGREYSSFILTVPRRTQLSVRLTVTSGPAVSFITMDDRDFDRYQNGEEFASYESFSVESKKEIRMDGVVETGTYHFVVERS